MRVEEAFDDQATEARALQILEPEEYQQVQNEALEMIGRTELDPAPEARNIIGGLITLGFLAGVTFLSDREVPAPMSQGDGGAYEATPDGKILVPLTPRQMAVLLEITLGDE